MQVGLMERSLTGLIDDRLTFDRAKLRNDVMARLATHQDAAHWARRADAHRRLAALDLGTRRVREVRPMSFARMDYQQLRGAGGGQHFTARRHSRLETF